ncbi:class I SAM-dependent methyltransferase [Novosphingobium sp. H3SJ31-1]|uniref:Class I SAM-dependent methyltransferase n=2 Tax=Novosphingobium album (ex Liu et al. 2023) TaxID=3031130 RepID=A0ABT5WKU0_9SPHN|nr:class I SAM-dependent methyltransferase [Novosphingobium album (ex Liu et al. 2023)]
MTDRQSHWENVYTAKADDSVSWFEETPSVSVRLIERATDARGSVIDIGGGASRLPDALLDLGFTDVAILDLSAQSLRIARARLASRGDKIRWIAMDITRWTPDRLYDVWHDRVAFHFLTDADDQARYVDALRNALAPRGIAIIGTFAPDGPERCSGLPVVRHDSESLVALLGSDFSLLSEERHEHRTPAGVIQQFQFSVFRKN